jgi:hypothetical protein
MVQAEQLGHEDPGFTFRVYQRAVNRRDRLAGTHLQAFDRALDLGGNRQKAGGRGARRSPVDHRPRPEIRTVEP